MKRGSTVLFASVIVGLAVCSLAANALYNRKVAMAPYEAEGPTLFYAGMDKFLSNVSWMTLIQWEGAHSGKPTDADVESLARKLNSLTNLDPRFEMAYIDGALSLSPTRADLASKLLEKASRLGLSDNWRVQMYAGTVALQNEGDLPKAIRCFDKARKLPNAPPFVESLWMHARAREADADGLAVMDMWSAYINSLRADQGPQKDMARGELIERGERVVADCDNQLKNVSDGKAREQLLSERTEAEKRLKEVGAPPTTNPSAASAT